MIFEMDSVARVVNEHENVQKLKEMTIHGVENFYNVKYILISNDCSISDSSVNTFVKNPLNFLASPPATSTDGKFSPQLLSSYKSLQLRLDGRIQN